LSAIQKALIAVLGVGAISALSDDGYDDTVPPVITIIGGNPITVELGDTYTDQGATAFDEFHGETPVSSSGTVDTSTVGTYTITYTATDLDGNTATATRTVNVVDTTAPVVTVTGDNPATVELGGTYTDAGATATDASGTVTGVSSGTVDPDTLGT
jgi:flagellin-like hook-associated protein FlgL